MSPLRIFISSTFVDLEAHRAAVHSAIQKMEGHANDMIYWSADERTPEASSVERVTDSDLVILILAHRYGVIPPGHTRSIVQLEYEAARAHNIPVLAFLVDATYPWPPDHIDLDRERRGRLDEFKALVQASTVVTKFTNPTSLAMAVTQALHNWEKRQTAHATAEEPQHKIVLVSARAHLTDYPNIVTPVGSTIYDLPLLGRVTRAHDIATPINGLASLVGKTIDEPPFTEWHQVLTEHARKIWSSRQVYFIDGAQYYLTTRRVASFGPTIMSQAMADPDPPIGSGVPPAAAPAPGEFTRMFMQPQTPSYAGLHPPSSTGIGALDTSRGEDYLGIRLDGDGASVMHVRPKVTPVIRRPFLFESLCVLQGCTFEIVEATDNFTMPTKIYAGPVQGFRSAVQAIFRKYTANDLPRLTWTFWVSRQTIAEIILSVGRRAAAIHDKGRIHGDIKPQNVLVTRDGIVLFDTLNLEPGAISPAVTPNWGAPEQVTLQPVSTQTDVFPFGLMIVKLLHAKLSGERITYVLPDGFETRILKSPTIRNAEVTPSSGREEWHQLAERTLSFEADRRPSMSAFLHEYTSLVQEHSLPGDVNVCSGSMAAWSLVKFGRSREEPGSIIDI